MRVFEGLNAFLATPFGAFLNSEFFSTLVAILLAVLLWRANSRLGAVEAAARENAEAQDGLRDALTAREDIERFRINTSNFKAGAESSDGFIDRLVGRSGEPAGALETHFEEGRMHLAAIADALVKLEARVTDGRRKRKYKGVRPSDRALRAVLLMRDDVLTEDLAEEIVQVEEAWRPFKSKRRAAPKEVLERMADLVSALNLLVNRG